MIDHAIEDEDTSEEAAKRLTRHLRRNLGTFEANPLGLAACIAAVYPDTRLSDFIAAAEQALGRPLLDLSDRDENEAPRPLEDEVAITLRDPDWITPSQAAFRVRKDAGTVIRWCKDDKIGRKIGGRWYVYEPALDKLIRLGG